MLERDLQELEATIYEMASSISHFVNPRRWTDRIHRGEEITPTDEWERIKLPNAKMDEYPDFKDRTFKQSHQKQVKPHIPLQCT